MPVTVVTSPDGAEYEVNHPETATDEEILAYARQEFGKPAIEDEQNASAREQFMYAFDKEGNLTTYAGDILESKFPLGAISFDFSEGFQYLSPTERYGEEFMEATPEQRREIIMQRREEQLGIDYGEDFREDAEGMAATLGQVAKAVADPAAALIPVGRGYKAIAATSGGLGATYEVLEDVAENKPIDVKEAALTGAVSAVGVPVTIAGARTVANIVQDKVANKAFNNAQKVINEKAAQGYVVKDMPKVLEEAGVDMVKLASAQSKLGKKLTVPAFADAAEIAANQAITRDSAVTRTISKGLDKYLGTLSTRVRNISEPVFGRLRKFEYNIHVNTQNKLNAVKPFIEMLGKTDPKFKQRIARTLFNGNFDAAEGLMRVSNPELLPQFSAVKGLLESTANELVESGHSLTKLDNYFPRKVNDLEGLLESLGTKKKSSVEKALQKYAQTKGFSSVAEVPPEERAEVVDLVMRGYKQTTDGGKPRFLKPRTIEQVAPEHMKYYATPEESIQSYLRGAVNDIERRKFFGRSVNEDMAGRFNTDSSIGRFIADELDAGNIPSEKQDELRDLLQARFVGGETATGGVLGGVRDLGYMGTIANPISALTQLGDLGITSALKGLGPTFRSMFGAKEAKLIDIGLDDVISKELSNARKTARGLNELLKYAGFKRVDRLTKETFINASLKRARALARTEKGQQELRKNWGNVFGDEFESLVDDLNSKVMSDNVKFYLFNELSGVQPITLSEMPEAYLTSPNGRVFYMLKSFTLKLYDVVRNNIVKEYKQGNKMKAVKNAALLAGYFTAANTGVGVTKDLLLGRDVRPEDLPSRSLWALLGGFGINQYVSERYLSRGDMKGALINTFAPATPVIDAAFKLGTELPKEDPNIETTLKAVPLVGPIVYNWFGGGAEKFNERLD